MSEKAVSQTVFVSFDDPSTRCQGFKDLVRVYIFKIIADLVIH